MTERVVIGIPIYDRPTAEFFEAIIDRPACELRSAEEIRGRSRC